MKCECGCDIETKKGKRFIRGHNFINKEDRKFKLEGKRRCKRCNKIKLLDNFYKRNNNKYLSYCKSCNSLMQKEYHVNNPNYWKEHPMTSARKIIKRTQRRKTHLSTGGITYKKLNKRDYPKDESCEICGDNIHLLGYHHWDDLNLSKGIWVCHWCDTIGELTDISRIDTLRDKYLKLKLMVDEMYAKNE